MAPGQPGLRGLLQDGEPPLCLRSRAWLQGGGVGTVGAQPRRTALSCSLPTHTRRHARVHSPVQTQPTCTRASRHAHTVTRAHSHAYVCTQAHTCSCVQPQRCTHALMQGHTQVSGTQELVPGLSRVRHLGPFLGELSPPRPAPGAPTLIRGRVDLKAFRLSPHPPPVRRAWSPGLAPTKPAAPGVTKASCQSLGDVKTAGGTEGPSLVPRLNQENPPARSPRCGL